MNDYIIAVDRDGQPYIAHAWGRGANGQHKYIAKIGEGAKARYFYTQEQLRAFQQGARQGAQNAANKAKEKASDAVGRVRENSVLLNVGNQYRAAQRAHQYSKSSDPQTAKRGKEGYESNNTLGGKVYKAQQKAKDSVDSTKQKVKNVKDKVDNEVKKTKEANAKLTEARHVEKNRKAIGTSFDQIKDYDKRLSRDFSDNKEFKSLQSDIHAKYREAMKADSVEEQQRILKEMTPMIAQYNGYVRQYNENSKKK